MNRLLTESELHESPVVANCCMNRERQLEGTNSYSYELRCRLLDHLIAQADFEPVSWLDVCCGSGTALIEVAQHFEAADRSKDVAIVGIDLAGHFVSHAFGSCLELVKTSLENYDITRKFDLVTCVHGLHYIGDKLGAISKMANCLSTRGKFIANLDLSNFRFAAGQNAGRTVARRLRDNGIEYDSRARLIRCTGKGKVSSFRLHYEGADDRAGPNYSGQPAVDSYYSRVTD